jgi:hypothetical protein
MIVVLNGPPGNGAGTLAEALAENIEKCATCQGFAAAEQESRVRSRSPCSPPLRAGIMLTQRNGIVGRYATAGEVTAE